jgi:hypothetical protein
MNRSARAATIGLAMILGLGLAIPRHPTRAEMRPYIPPPKRDAARDSSGADSRNPANPAAQNEGQIPGPRKIVRAFPAAEFLAFLTYTDEQLELLSRSEEPAFDGAVLGRLRARLAAVAPPGVYRFDRACPLVFDPDFQEDGAAYVELQIECLPAHHRRAYALRLYPGNALEGTRFASYKLLRALNARREFTGEARLVAGDLEKGFAPLWRWQAEAALPYANAMLDSLRARYADESEAQLLAPSTLRANTATLLRRFAGLASDAAYREQRDLVADFRAVYPDGAWIVFGRSCPLVVEDALRREPGTELFRLHLRISCLTESPRFRPIRLLLPGKTLQEGGEVSVLDAFRLAPGQKIHAGLKFRAISSENTPAGLQFLLLWDTIKDIRPDLPLVRPKP